MLRVSKFRLRNHATYERRCNGVTADHEFTFCESKNSVNRDRSWLYASIVFFESPFSTVIIRRKESMNELSESFICGREVLLQGLANFFEPDRVAYLGAVSIGHIEDV